jgi:pilus assembly protein CpaE
MLERPELGATGAKAEAQADTTSRLSYPRMQANTTTVLICPNPAHRRLLVQALENQNSTVSASLQAYPSYNDTQALAETDCDAFIVDLDSDRDSALDLVEALCSRKPSATVIVYSGTNQADLLISSMRAGAREFLAGTVSNEVLADALLRAAARRAETITKKEHGKMLMFWGSKGGSGTTTLAANFAIALRNETGANVALLDLNPQLGDVAVLLGLNPRFTVADALRNPLRLDEEFISTLVTDHRSGVSVFAAPDTYTSSMPAEEHTLRKLIDLVGARFPYAVIDAGPGLGVNAEPLFQLASTIYLVTQVDIPSLRNSQRLVSYLSRVSGPQVELVLNRFDGRKVEFDEDRLSKTIGITPKWKVPNDFAAVRRACNTATPLISEKSPVSQVLQQMARAACGKLPDGGRKKKFSLFG